MLRTALRLSARRPVHLVSTIDQCQAMVEQLLNSSNTSVAIDCEGESLGRFGSLALVQLATDQHVFLVDTIDGGPRLVEPLRTLLASHDVIKVFHDCREDASLLLHQHAAPLQAVFDVQVGFKAWLERKNLDIYQASLAEVLRTFRLGSYRAHRWDELESKPVAPHRWRKRPLDPEAVRYAVEGVAHLLPLQRSICRALGDPSGDMVLRRTLRYVEYAKLNGGELPSRDVTGLRPGAPLQAMLAVKREDAAYFKLNHTDLTGAVLDDKELQDFKDLRPGDVVACRIKSLSDCQRFVYLQREGHGRLFFDASRRSMRVLPSQEELDAAFPDRQSTLYGHGQNPDGRPAITQERASYRESKPEVRYKPGSRGQPKVRDSGYKTAKLQRGADRQGA